MKTQKRRRREHKTDYSRRIGLLKSKSPRLVFRKTNKYVIAQYVVSKEAKDKVIFGNSSKDLIKYGWPNEFKNSLKSIPASYLLGLLMGKKIIKDKLEAPILDFGMLRMISKTRTYAFLKGLFDTGVKIKVKENTFPEEDKVKGKYLKKDFSKNFKGIKSKIESL